MPRAIQLSLSDDARLVAFLSDLGRESAAPLAYHLPFYRDALANAGVGDPVSFAIEEAGRLSAVLPGLVRRAESGTVFSSLPFFGPNAGVLTHADSGAGERHRLLLEAATEWMSKQDHPLSLSIVTSFRQTDFTPYDTHLPGAVVIDRFTQYFDLQATEWPAKVRYDLRRSAGLGVTVERQVTAERIDTFYSLYEENCRAVGIAIKPRAVIDTLLHSPDHAKIYFAYHEGAFVAGLLVLWGPSVVSYYLPCNLDSARSLQPGMVLIDAAAQEARAAGLRWWNWEGSPSRESGVYMFKKRWGSTESPYRTYVAPFQPKEVFAALGREKIAAEYPYFFVYPFHLL